jgi:hypothetical protein
MCSGTLRAKRSSSSSVGSSPESLPSFKEPAQKELSPERAPSPSFIGELRASADVPVEMEPVHGQAFG